MYAGTHGAQEHRSEDQNIKGHCSLVFSIQSINHFFHFYICTSFQYFRGGKQKSKMPKGGSFIVEAVNLWQSVHGCCRLFRNKYYQVFLRPTQLFCVSFVTCQLVDGIFSNLVSELYLVVPVQLKLWGSTRRTSRRWARVLNQHQ